MSVIRGLEIAQKLKETVLNSPTQQKQTRREQYDKYMMETMRG